MLGRIHSVQTLGTVDGPGVRFVLFMQGCPLRCACCHNPDTWDVHAGREVTPEEILAQIKRCRPYFGEAGGVTVSGGEPLLQPEFVRELFLLCKKEGIHTALDTSGCLYNEHIAALLEVTDLCLLDHKMPNGASYKQFVGCDIAPVEHFLQILNERCIPTWLRRVIITGITDGAEDTRALFSLQNAYPCVEKVELLPFRTLCISKYEKMGIPFPLAGKPQTTEAQIKALLDAANR
jgi:pyruvate formate lyase activating enzyme